MASWGRPPAIPAPASPVRASRNYPRRQAARPISDLAPALVVEAAAALVSEVRAIAAPVLRVQVLRESQSQGRLHPRIIPRSLADGRARQAPEGIQGCTVR